MAKGAGLAVGIAAIIGIGLYAWGSSASADEGDGEDGGPDWPDDAGKPGGGEGGAPRPMDGGETWGDAPADAGYLIPADWDPARGLYISPDCEVVVEAPGWFCGLGGPDGMTPQPFGGFGCTAEVAESYHDTMAIEGNGVAGYIDFLIELGMQPEEIALQILSEVSPLCADLPASQWSEGLWGWYSSFLERVISWYEEYWGIEFEEGTA